MHFIVIIIHAYFDMIFAGRKRSEEALIGIIAAEISVEQIYELK